MAIPTQFSVAKARKCPLANPAQPVDGANPLTAESIGFISGASALPAKAAGDIGAPSELAAQLASDIDSPSELAALSAVNINNPTALSALPVEDIDNASLFSALSVGTINNPSIVTAEPVAAVDDANVINAESASELPTPSFSIDDGVRWKFAGTLDGWTANNATLTSGANTATAVMTSRDFQLVKTGFTEGKPVDNILWVRMMCTTATVSTSVVAFTSNSKHGFLSQFRAESQEQQMPQGVFVDFYINLAESQDYLTDGMTSLRIDPYEGALETFEIDFIVIGSYANLDFHPRDQNDIELPSAASSEAQPAVPAPSALTANAGTQTGGTFPLNHARILYRNTLAINQDVSANNGASTAINTLKPNTWEKWVFSGGGGITFTLTDARLIDTVCIGAHNIGSQGGGTGVQYSPTLDGDDFVAFATGQDPVDDSAIMYHITSKVNVRRVRVIVSGGGDFEIGYISAGTSLQMQRPFFNGHQPYTDSDVTEYYSNRTESGEIIGRQIRRKGYETTYEWQNIDDGWYRDNIPEFKEYAKIRPMFIAWNLLEYPKDVAFGETTGDISSSMQNGTRTKRSGLSFTLKGV